MLFNINLTKNIPKNARSVLFRQLPLISRSVATTSNIETVDLAYSTYDYCGKASTKPPLIILHAMFGSRNNWDSMSKAIHETTGRKVISVDARNHGFSENSPDHTYLHQAHDVIKLLKKLELTKVSVLGHCMGGTTAMVLSLIRPDLVTSLAVEEVSPLTITPLKHLIMNLLHYVPTLSIPPGISMSEARVLADEHMKSLFADVHFRNYLLENLAQTDGGSYIWRINFSALEKNFLRNILTFPNNLKGLQYTGPTLFIGGSRSDHIGKNDLPETKDYFPSAELTFIEDGGHWVHVHKAEEFLQILRKFLIEN